MTKIIEPKQSLSLLTGHSSDVFNICYSNDQRYLVSSSNDMSVIIWDATLNKAIKRFSFVDFYDPWMGFSPDNKYFVCSDNKHTYLYDMLSNQMVLNKSKFSAYSFFEINKLLIRKKDIFYILDCQTNKKKKCFIEQPYNYLLKKYYLKMPLSINQVVHFISTENSDDKTFDPESDKYKNLFCDAIVISPSGKFLISYDSENIYKWDAKTFELIVSFSNELISSILCVTFSQNEDFCYIGNAEGDIYNLNMHSNELQGPFRVHCDWVRQIVTGPNTQFVTTCSNDQNIRIWNLKTWELVREFRGHEYGIVKITFESNNILSALYQNGTKRRWEINHDKLINQLTLRPKKKNKTNKFIHSSSEPEHLCFSNDNQLSAFVKRDAEKNVHIDIYETIHGVRIRTYSFYDNQMDYYFKNIAIISDNHKYIVFASDWNELLLINIQTGLLEQNFVIGRDGISSLDFSPNMKLLAVGTEYHDRVYIVDIATGKIKYILRNQIERIYSVKFSLDGKTLAVGCDGGIINIWNMKTKRLDKSLVVPPAKDDKFVSREWIIYTPEGKIKCSRHAKKYLEKKVF